MEPIKEDLSSLSLDELVDRIPANIQRRVENAMAIAIRIADTLERKKLSKAKFARMMGCRPSEVTRWLSGRHNFTVHTLSDIEAVLGIRLLQIEEKEEKIVAQNAFYTVGSYQILSNNSAFRLAEFDQQGCGWNYHEDEFHGKRRHPVFNFRVTNTVEA